MHLPLQRPQARKVISTWPAKTMKPHHGKQNAHNPHQKRKRAAKQS